MSGTSGEDGYVVIACTDRGRIGYRQIYGGIRVRVEPEPSYLSDMYQKLLGWATPTSTCPRFSIVIPGPVGGGNDSNLPPLAGVKAIQRGLAALRGKMLSVNPEAPRWARAFALKCAAPEPDEREVFMRASGELFAQFKRCR